MLRREILKKFGLLSAGICINNNAFALADKPQRVLRLAHITDVHIQHMLGAAKGFEKCLHHVQNLAIKPDFIFNGGDCIMGAKKSSLKQIEKQFNLFQNVMQSENALPVHHCVGNHDIWYGNEDFKGEKTRAMDSIGMAKPYYSFEKNGWHFIVLDSVKEGLNPKSYAAFIDEPQMNWLVTTLKNIPETAPIMIMSHIPILSASVFFDGKNYKENSWHIPGSWMHSDADELVKLFYKHSNVKIALSGHIHLLDRVEYNGMTYCCNGAVSGAWWTGNYKQTSPGYALVDLFDNGSFEVSYQDYTS